MGYAEAALLVWDSFEGENDRQKCEDLQRRLQGIECPDLYHQIEWERDNALELLEPTPKAKPGITLEEANIRVRDAIKNPKCRSLRTLAEAVGCSTGLVGNTAAWKAYRAELKRGKVPSPKVVSFTSQVEADIGKDDAELKRLIDDQSDDDEGSPLDPTSRKQPRRRKKL